MSKNIHEKIRMPRTGEEEEDKPTTRDATMKYSLTKY
jgi:hypothetical protein